MPKVAIDTKVITNEVIGDGVKKIVVWAPEIAIQAKPGQFVHVGITQGKTLLRRPLGIEDADMEKGTITLTYRIVGEGTKDLAACRVGDTINCVGPLGRGFELDCKNALLIGGGMGLAPLHFLARGLGNEKTSILMGGKNAAELFWQPMFDGLVKETFITTDDGSLGTKGFTVTLMPELLKKTDYDCIYVCGPQIMMEAAARIAKEAGIPCQVSLEKRMACGIGACLSCTCEGTDGGRKKVCKDGPVFWAEEVF